MVRSGRRSRAKGSITTTLTGLTFTLGADFGGNGTAVAASANVVAIGIAACTGHPISFWQFTRYGIVVTVLSTTLTWVYVWPLFL